MSDNQAMSSDRRPDRSTVIVPAVDLHGEDVVEDSSSSSSGGPTVIDDWVHEAHLDAIIPGYPDTTGGVVKNPALREIKFCLHTVPEVTVNTRIIAACGITHMNGVESPSEDGWFFSDFLLFNILCRGEGAQQTWICDEDCTPGRLYDRYKYTHSPGGYLHGSPARERKILLSDDVFKKRLITPVKGVPHTQILPTFLETLRKECDIARHEEQPVLVLLFGHGNIAGHGIVLGYPGQDSLNRKHKAVLSMADFKACAGTDVAITVLTTSCYGGGWATNPDLNYTAMTAAGENNMSASWGASASCGRSSGSVYVSVVVNTLVDGVRSPFAEPDQDLPALTQAAQANNVQGTQNEVDVSYTACTGQIYQSLFVDVDRLAYHHDIRFSAQDDAWGQCWSRRTGIPLGNFARKYNELANYAAPSDAYDDRDPATIEPSPGFSRYVHRFGSSITNRMRGSGFGRNTMQNIVQGQVQDYLNSMPGPDNLGPNTSVHGLFRRVIKDCSSLDISQVERAWQYVEYRQKKMEQADLLLQLSGVGLLKSPSGKQLSCAYFDAEKYRSGKLAAVMPGERRQRWSDIFRLVADAEIFPAPLPLQHGPEWPKPEHFIAAALTELTLSREAVEQKIKIMRKIAYDTAQVSIDNAMRAKPVRQTARAYLRQIGANARRLSPRKPTHSSRPSGSSTRRSISMGRPSLESRSRANTLTDSLKRMNIGSAEPEAEDSGTGKGKGKGKGRGRAYD